MENQRLLMPHMFLSGKFHRIHVLAPNNDTWSQVPSIRLQFIAHSRFPIPINMFHSHCTKRRRAAGGTTFAWLILVPVMFF